MKVSHWSNFGALTPPFDFTPPRKPHVHPYPPDGFIPQAGAFAPVWGCGRVGWAMGWQPLSPGFDSRRGQFFLLSTHIWGYVAPKRDHSLSHPFVCEGYLDSAQPFALGAPRARIGARASWAEIPTDCRRRSSRYDTERRCSGGEWESHLYMHTFRKKLMGVGHRRRWIPGKALIVRISITRRNELMRFAQ